MYFKIKYNKTLKTLKAMSDSKKPITVADKIQYLNQYYFIRLYLSEEYARWYLESVNGIDSNNLDSDFIEEIERIYNDSHGSKARELKSQFKMEAEEYRGIMLSDESRGN